MLRGFSTLAAALLAGLVALPVAAQTSKATSKAKSDGGAAPVASVPIPVTDSGKDIEILVAKLLKERLKLETSLKLVNDDPNNLRLQIPIGSDKKQDIPRVLSVIDTAVVARDKDGKAVSQTISIIATADLSFTEKQIPKLLQWSNAWNARMIPIRTFIADKRVYTAMAVLSTKSEPVSSDRVIGSFLGVVRSWAAVMRDLRANKFLPEKK